MYVYIVFFRSASLSLHTLMWVFHHYPAPSCSSFVMILDRAPSNLEEGQLMCFGKTTERKLSFQNHPVSLYCTELRFTPPPSTHYPNAVDSCANRGCGCMKNITLLSGDKW